MDIATGIAPTHHNAKEMDFGFGLGQNPPFYIYSGLGVAAAADIPVGLKIVDTGRPEALISLRECASTSWQSQVVIASKCCEAAQRRKAPKREPAGFR